MKLPCGHVMRRILISDGSRSGPHKYRSPHIPVSGISLRRPLPSEATTLRTQHARPPIHTTPSTRQRSGYSSAQAGKISCHCHQGHCAGGPSSTPAAGTRRSPPLQCWWVMYWGTVMCLAARRGLEQTLHRSDGIIYRYLTCCPHFLPHQVAAALLNSTSQSTASTTTVRTVFWRP